VPVEASRLSAILPSLQRAGICNRSAMDLQGSRFSFFGFGRAWRPPTRLSRRRRNAAAASPPRTLKSLGFLGWLCSANGPRARGSDGLWRVSTGATEIIAISPLVSFCTRPPPKSAVGPIPPGQIDRQRRATALPFGRRFALRTRSPRRSICGGPGSCSAANLKQAIVLFLFSPVKRDDYPGLDRRGMPIL